MIQGRHIILVHNIIANVIIAATNFCVFGPICRKILNVGIHAGIRHVYYACL